MAAAVKPAAVAVFAKTPELSPVKTRLAAQIGSAAAQAIYRQSLHLMRLRLQAVAAQGIAVYWAVAEKQAPQLQCWRDFPALWTGDGALGQRLYQVQRQLMRQVPRVLLIGTDCPQLLPELILQAAHDEGTVIGPANDGGFYLFATDRAMTAAQWNTPQYSGPHTLTMLQSVLPEHRQTLLPFLTDIDDIASLHQCCNEFHDRGEADSLLRLIPR